MTKGTTIAVVVVGVGIIAVLYFSMPAKKPVSQSVSTSNQLLGFGLAQASAGLGWLVSKVTAPSAISASSGGGGAWDTTSQVYDTAKPGAFAAEQNDTARDNAILG